MLTRGLIAIGVAMGMAIGVGALIGVLLTAAGVWVACDRAGTGIVENRMVIIPGEGVDGITTVAHDRYAVSVEIQFFYRTPRGMPPSGVLGAVPMTDLKRALDASMAQDYGKTPLSLWPPGVPGIEPPSLPARWFRGLSTAEDRGTGLWKEAVYGWPFRCVRVRGRAVGDGPMPLSQLPPTWAGVPGWGVAWRETAISIAALGSPASALVLVLLVAKGPIQRRRRKRRGLCPSCGYDLRGIATGCPECGHSEPDAPARETRRDASG